MLHMVVHTHEPQDCPFRGRDEAEQMTAAVQAFAAAGSDRPIEVLDSWASRGAHEMFLLVEAPHAHAIEDALLASGLVARSRSRVLPVVPLAEVLRAAADG